MTIDAYQSFIGQTSLPIRNEVEKGAIRKFVDAIGDENPVYRTEGDNGRIVAPPTFSRTFNYGWIDGFSLPKDGLIHADQTFHYGRPMYSGDVLDCTTTLLNVFEKTGKLGRMTFFVMEHRATDESGDSVVLEKSTIIYRPEVEA